MRSQGIDRDDTGLRKTKMETLGCLTKAYIQILAGFKAQLKL